MPKKIPHEVRNQAMQLYLEGKAAKEIAAGLERSEQNIGNELRKNEGKLYYGSSEKYNRRWSLIDENEKEAEMWWERD